MEPDEELAFLDRRLEVEADPAFALQIMITKAKLLAGMGREGEATHIPEECSRSPFGDEIAAYFVAQIVAQSLRYSEAEIFLQQAERQIAENLSGYYRNCTLLLHAYCAVKIVKRDLARTHLATVEDRDEKLFWLRTRPVISVGLVEALIAGESP